VVNETTTVLEKEVIEDLHEWKAEAISRIQENLHINKILFLCEKNIVYKQLLLGLYQHALRKKNKILTSDLRQNILVGEKDLYYYLDKLECLKIYHFFTHQHKTLPVSITVFPLEAWNYELTTLLDDYINEFAK
jgi:hypothetical protein